MVHHNCQFNRDPATNVWSCRNCGYVFPLDTEKPPYRNCDWDGKSHNCDGDVPRRTKSEIIEVVAEYCEDCMYVRKGKCFYNSCAGNPCGIVCKTLAKRHACPANADPEEPRRFDWPEAKDCPSGKCKRPELTQAGES